MATLKIVVHPEKCIASGHCAKAVPAVFAQRELDGTVVLLDANPPSGHAVAVERAARLCPVAAIKICAAPEVS